MCFETASVLRVDVLETGEEVPESQTDGMSERVLRERASAGRPGFGSLRDNSPKPSSHLEVIREWWRRQE